MAKRNKPSQSSGVILDASVLIDVCLIDEWQWISDTYGNPYIAEYALIYDNLGRRERACAEKYITAIDMVTEDELTLFSSLRTIHRGLSQADRAAIVLAKSHNLICGCDDLKMVHACEAIGVSVLRTLGILSDMNRLGLKTKQECVGIVDMLRNSRNKHLAEDVLRGWEEGLQ